jgi:ketosteroid isomerase-like protein
MEAIVHDNNTRLEKCYLAGDADILAEMYDDNAKLSPDGDNFYVGKQKIVAFWKENLAAAKITAMRTNTMSVSGNSEVLYETGITYSETLYKDSLYKNTVKFVNIWKRQPNKSWKLVVDFWNDPKK